MKIKVVWESEFDSNEFYDEEDRIAYGEPDLETFTEGVLDFLADNPYDIISEMKVTLIKE